MNTNANANTNKSGMSEICELTDDELDAVNGGMLLTTGGNGPIEFSVTIAEAN
jgi:bacteriocin-like protein